MNMDSQLLDSVRRLTARYCVGAAAITSVIAAALLYLGPEGGSPSDQVVFVAVFSLFGVLLAAGTLILYMKPFSFRVNPQSQFAQHPLVKRAAESKHERDRALPSLFFTTVIAFSVSAMAALLGFVAAILLRDARLAIPFVAETIVLWVLVFPRKGRWSRQLSST